MSFDILIEAKAWEDVGLAALSVRAEAATLAHFGLDPDLCEGAVLACDDAKISELNAEFRAKPTPTNVLSWPAEERATPGEVPPLPQPDFEGVIPLGDIAISYETCAREAEDAGKPMADHVTHLLIHGILHLLGFDHISDTDAVLMERIEIQILETLGIESPY